MSTPTTQTASAPTLAAHTLKLGDRVTIPIDAVAPCLHGLLEDAEVVGFRHNVIDGALVVLKTRVPWQAAPHWPFNETIGIRLSHFTTPSYPGIKTIYEY